MKGERKRSATILARKPGELNPPSAGRRIAAGAGYRVGDASVARSDNRLNRHLAVPHRGAGGETFRRIDDGVGVDAVVAIEVVDGAGLTKVLDAERFKAMPAHAAEPAERGRMAVDHADDAAVARQRRQQLFDMA